MLALSLAHAANQVPRRGRKVPPRTADRRVAHRRHKAPIQHDGPVSTGKNNRRRKTTGGFYPNAAKEIQATVPIAPRARSSGRRRITAAAKRGAKIAAST